MRAVVLVGGVGMRLRPLTEQIPKPVVNLAGRPFLTYMLEWLGRHGVDEVVLACGFQPDRLREVLGDGEPGGPRIRYVVEPEPLGTAGAIRFAAEGFEGRFLALNGDCLSDLDLSKLVARHEEAGAKATVGLYPVEDPSAFGLVLRDPEGRVTEFLEKPEPGSEEAERAEGISEPEINAGMYVLEPGVLESIPPGRKVSIEREIFPALIGQGLIGVRLEGYWQDIGTPERYLQANWDILEGRIETPVETRPDAVNIDPTAEIYGQGGPGAPDIGPRAVIGPRVKVGSGARIQSSVIYADCEIGPGAAVFGSILGPGVTVDRGAGASGLVVGAEETIEA